MRTYEAMCVFRADGDAFARGKDAVREELVVLLLHAGCHVGFDDTGAQLDHGDVVFAQPVGDVVAEHHAHLQVVAQAFGQLEEPAGEALQLAWTSVAAPGP